MIDRVHRAAELDALGKLLRQFPVVAILGARQTGKTTLARDFAAREVAARGVAARDDSATRATPIHRFDLEDPRDAERLRDPMTALEPLRGLVVLDEIQRTPDVFPTLRVLADRPGVPARFLVLGSASPDLLRQSSESLAGRIAYRDLDGFALDEVGPAALDRLWLRGGYPRSFLATDDAASVVWRREFVRTFLERDLAQLGSRVPALTMRSFWTMLAHYHGQVWNGAELARAQGVGAGTIRRYLDTLEATYAIRVLRPWHENLKKRQVRSPKVYISDSGLLHSLLAIETHEQLMGHPKVGASFEGLGIREVIRRLGAWSEECHFWATHAGAELDLLVVSGETRLGFEFKRTVAPRTTRSMHVAIADLGLTRLDVIHAGEGTYPLTDRIRAVALRRVLDDLEPLR